jgi:hypothetical protein
MRCVPPSWPHSPEGPDDLTVPAQPPKPAPAVPSSRSDYQLIDLSTDIISAYVRHKLVRPDGLQTFATKDGKTRQIDALVLVCMQAYAVGGILERPDKRPDNRDAVG